MFLGYKQGYKAIVVLNTGKMPGKRYTNNDIIERLDELNRNTNEEIIDKLDTFEKKGVTSKNLTFVAIGLTLIAITVPLIVKLTNMPEYGQWIIVIVYFCFGLFLIISSYIKIKKLNDIL